MPEAARAASPADVRCDLDPVQVDAVADQLHSLTCTPLIGSANFTDRHRDYDLGRARFLLQGLRDTGWTLNRAPVADAGQRYALLVAFDDDDADCWRPALNPHRVALTSGTSPLLIDGLRPTEVHVTPRASGGDRYGRVVDTIRRSLLLMRPERRPVINLLYWRTGDA